MTKHESTPTEQKIEDFAEDLGRMLGTARAKAEGWLGQRQAIAKHLAEIRETASKLLTDLGHEAQRAVRRGRPPASSRSQRQPVHHRSSQRRRLSGRVPCAQSAGQRLVLVALVWVMQRTAGQAGTAAFPSTALKTTSGKRGRPTRAASLQTESR